MFSSAPSGLPAHLDRQRGRKNRSASAHPRPGPRHQSGGHPGRPFRRISAVPRGRDVPLADGNRWRQSEAAHEWRRGVPARRLRRQPHRLLFLACVGAGRAYKVSIDGGEQSPVGHVPFRPVSVSSDGKMLLGVSWDAERRRSAMALMSTDGGEPRLLRDVPVLGSAPGWAPDGGVTYVDVRDGRMNVWVRPLESGDARQITHFQMELPPRQLTAKGAAATSAHRKGRHADRLRKHLRLRLVPRRPSSSPSRAARPRAMS